MGLTILGKTKDGITLKVWRVIKRKHYRCWKTVQQHKVDAILSFLSLFLIGQCVAGFFWPRNDEWPIVSLLTPDSTQFVLRSERGVRISLLSEVILQHESTHAQWQSARESERMQARLSFVGVMAVLLATILRPGRVKDKPNMLLIAVTLFAGFYLFDVHMVYQGDRQDHVKGALDTTIIQLSKMSLSDSTLYYIDYSKLNAYLKNKGQNTRQKKLLNSLRPDLSQMAFYYMPLIIFIGLHLSFGQKKRSLHSQDTLNT